ncbi:MAG: efflux RND transporter periplasmic adaptor subunit [Planctomycetota bacterium]|nr:efflux RND transporter periplasmic adaptor subunit [Planctomycetota bacterium]
MTSIPPTHGIRGGARFLFTTVLVLALLLFGAWYGFLRDTGSETADVPLTPPLERGPLRVTVNESGNLESLNAKKIVNVVEGRTTIDFIVPEGTVLTEEDVAKKTVLVRLNAAALEEKREKQELDVSSASDQHLNAKAALEIQLQQNDSDRRKADLDVRFAMLDLERYVGKAFAEQLLSAYHAVVDGPAGAAPAEGGEGPGAGLDGARLQRLIGSLLESDALEGEALQRIRTLKSDIHLADEQHRRAEEKLRNSIKLEEKGYVSRQDLEADQLALEQREIERQRARTARDQFVQYDFRKEVAKLISGVVEAEDSRSRVEKKAKAAEAQKTSAVKAKERQLVVKRERLAELTEQYAALTIRATVPGLVVYASSGSRRRRGSDDRIDIGASVRQGQTLIQIPDANSLGVITKVHESAIRNLRTGLEATVEVEALPGSRIPARVSKVNRMPDAASWWENPDLKVYHTELQLLGGHPTLKPGMSADVEILITTLDDVLSAPVQAVTGTADQPAVFVWKDGEVQRRDVVLGLASDYYVEIKSGVKAGDRLLLDPPREAPANENGNGNGNGKGKGKQKKAPGKTPSAPANATAGKGRPPAASGTQPGAKGSRGGQPSSMRGKRPRSKAELEKMRKAWREKMKARKAGGAEGG